LPKSAKTAGPGEKKSGAEGLRKALLSIGVDEKSVDKLLASRYLERVIVPIYWKDGLVYHSQSLWLSKLPDFLRSFEKEFPDGQTRWDPDYDEHNIKDNRSEVAVRIAFNYQEGDQGDHWSPKPTEMEEESYQSMLKRLSYKGSDPVQAQAVLHGK